MEEKHVVTELQAAERFIYLLERELKIKFTEDQRMYAIGYLVALLDIYTK